MVTGAGPALLTGGGEGESVDGRGADEGPPIQPGEGAALFSEGGAEPVASGGSSKEPKDRGTEGSVVGTADGRANATASC